MSKGDVPGAQVETILSFLARLRSLGGLLLALAGRPLQLVIELRQEGRKVLLDLSEKGVKVVEGGTSLDAPAGMAATKEDLHQVLLGRMSITDGMETRRLLLRGGLYHHMAFVPVLDVAPALYEEHLLLAAAAEDTRGEGGEGRVSTPEPGGSPGLLTRLLGVFAYLGGRVVGRLPRSLLIAAFRAMARGLSKFSTFEFPEREEPLVEARSTAPALVNPLDPPPPGALAAAGGWLVRGGLFLAGFWVGLLTRRLGLRLDLFRLLERMAAGVGRCRVPAEA